MAPSILHIQIIPYRRIDTFEMQLRSTRQDSLSRWSLTAAFGCVWMISMQVSMGATRETDGIGRRDNFTNQEKLKPTYKQVFLFLEFSRNSSLTQRQTVGIKGRCTLSQAHLRFRSRFASCDAVGTGAELPVPISRICILIPLSFCLLASSSTSSTVGFW